MHIKSMPLPMLQPLRQTAASAKSTGLTAPAQIAQLARPGTVDQPFTTAPHLLSQGMLGFLVRLQSRNIVKPNPEEKPGEETATDQENERQSAAERDGDDQHNQPQKKTPGQNSMTVAQQKSAFYQRQFD